MEQQGFTVVGIGASAGGLEALEELFDGLEDNTGMAFVIVQHLSPDYKSLMDELLRKHTKMQVNSVTETTQLRPNHVYLNPKGNNIICKGNKLLLSQRSAKSQINLPIDEFFHTLGYEHKENSISVILSGTGTDGSRGIRTIKEKGGLIIVQNPVSAQFDGMPNAALYTRLPDLSLSTSQIAKELNNISSGFPSLIRNNNGALKLSSNEIYVNILNRVHKHSGINFNEYKHETITRRIERRMVVNHVTKLEEYNNILKVNNEETDLLFRDFLIGVTRFFRNPEVFEFLNNKVLPLLIKRKEIRIWSVGCSTGEEAYTLAILLEELSLKLKTNINYKILASDVDVDSLSIAANGVYPINIMSEISPELINKYFVKKDHKCIVNKKIRGKIIFSKHNILENAPFINIDLIICRNLFIYMNAKTQQNILNTFLFALNENSYLLMGNSETIADAKEYFKTLSSKFRIYENLQRKKFLAPGLLRNIKFPKDDVSPKATFTSSGLFEKQATEEENLNVIKNLMVKTLCTDSLILDKKNNILYFSEKVSKYLEVSKLIYNKNIFELLKDKTIVLSIKNALKKVLESKNEIHLENIFRQEKSTKYKLNLKIKYVGEKTSFTDYMIFIQFNEEQVKEQEIEKYDLGKMDTFAKHCIRNLELEVEEMGNELKRTVGNLETSNEELQSSNEELLSSNEELQSTNEELQSVNEELFTVNSEVQTKNEELTRLNDDISNLLENTDIGTLFLNKDLKVRKFTPILKKYFKFCDTDINRSIEDFSFKLSADEKELLLSDIRKVFETQTVIEKEYRNTDNLSFLIKIRPFISTDDDINGIILSFLDVTHLILTESQLKAAKQKAEESDKLKSAFLANMSHEIRTPMNAIIGFAELLNKNTISQEERTNFTGIINTQGNYLLSLIDDIIDFSKIESNSLKINNHNVNIKALLNDVLNIFKMQSTKNRKIALSVHDDMTDIIIRTDELRLKQIIINLVSNAVKFTEKGSVIFGCEINNKNELEFFVKDSGVGMTIIEQKHIFERFYQIYESPNHNRDKKKKGTGLGLAITKALVHLLGGNISVKSGKNIGSQFYITLPFEPLKTIEEYNLFDNSNKIISESELKNRYKGKTILIAEDTEPSFLILKHFLDVSGAKILRAKNGVEAVDLATKKNVSIVLMDLDMPIMGGFTASKKIKKLKPDLSIIIQTAYAADYDLQKIENYEHINDYLIKPINRNKLYVTLDRNI